MHAAAASVKPPPPPPRDRLYTAVDPRCEWTRTADADTLVVDVSGFRKEELKVLYNTSRKLKVTGERQVDDDGARWAHFLKTFPVPRSIDAEAIRAMMDKEDALLYVVLPKGSSSSSSSSDRQKEQLQPESSLSHGEQKGGTGNADGSSSGSFLSAQEDAEERIDERGTGLEEGKENIQKKIATEDVTRTDAGDANAVKEDGVGKSRTDSSDANNVKDGVGKSTRWWKKIRPLHVLGFVLILTLIGVGVSVVCVMFL